MVSMIYRGLEWKKCPFCGKLSLSIDDERLFNMVKYEHDESAVSINCRCGAQMWAYPREAEENTYANMLKVLNNKWNTRGGKSK